MSVSSEKFELAADDLDSALERVAASLDSIDNRSGGIRMVRVGKDTFESIQDTEDTLLQYLQIR